MSKSAWSRNDFYKALPALRLEWLDGQNYNEMSTALSGLLHASEKWADEMIVDVLSKKYGDYLSASMVCAMRWGTSVLRVKGNTQVPRSFVRTCAIFGRVDLIRRVAALGKPSALDEQCAGAPYGQSTTRTGMWLDILCCAGQRSTSTLPMEIQDLAEHSVGAMLAEILIEHDPEHRGIPFMAGNAGHALVMAALMRQRLAASTTESALEPEFAPELSMQPSSPPEHAAPTSRGRRNTL